MKRIKSEIAPECAVILEDLAERIVALEKRSVTHAAALSVLLESIKEQDGVKVLKDLRDNLLELVSDITIILGDEDVDESYE